MGGYPHKYHSFHWALSACPRVKSVSPLEITHFRPSSTRCTSCVISRSFFCAIFTTSDAGNPGFAFGFVWSRYLVIDVFMSHKLNPSIGQRHQHAVRKPMRLCSNRSLGYYIPKKPGKRTRTTKLACILIVWHIHLGVSRACTTDVIKGLTDTSGVVQMAQTARSEQLLHLSIAIAFVRTKPPSVCVITTSTHRATSRHVLPNRYPGLEGSGRRVTTTYIKHIGWTVNPGRSAPSAIM